jgi:hypothetical protein
MSSWIVGFIKTHRSEVMKWLATIAAAVLAGVLLDHWRVFWTPTPSEGSVELRAESGQYHWPPLDKLSKQQLARMPELKELTVVTLPNESSSPLVNGVVTVPKEGVVEVVDKDKNSVVFDFTGRVYLPIIPSMDERIVYLWHKDKFRPDEKIVIAAENMGRHELPVEYANYDEYWFYRRWFWISGGVLTGLAVWFVWGGVRKWRARRGAAASPTSGPPPTTRPAGTNPARPRPKRPGSKGR